MSRGLIGFLIFLAVILLGFGVVGYVLGPNVLAFVFHSERSTAPVVMVDLLQFADADAERNYRQDYGKPARAMIEAVGGQRIWSARAGDVVRGLTRDGWTWLTLIEYPSRAAVIELVTSSDYRALQNAGDPALKRSALLAATQKAAFTDAGTTAYVVRLLAGVDQGSIADYESEWSKQDEALLARHHGRVVWAAQINPLASDAAQRCDKMLIYGFPEVALRNAWVDDPERETLQTLQQRLFRRDVLLLAIADADAPLGAGSPRRKTPLDNTN